MGCKSSCKKLFKACKLLLKIVLGLLDIVTDFLFSFTLLSGEFKLALYFASDTREEYDEAVLSLSGIENLGWMILVLPWIPGLIRIAYVAAEESWDITRKEITTRLMGYTLALIAWPIFPNLM